MWKSITLNFLMKSISKTCDYKTSLQVSHISHFTHHIITCMLGFTLQKSLTLLQFMYYTIYILENVNKHIHKQVYW